MKKVKHLKYVIAFLHVRVNTEFDSMQIFKIML